MRNTFLVVFTLLFCTSAWAVDPLVGPGKVAAEKDEKGQVKGANAGAGPHRSFHMQLERRADRPEEAIEKQRKEKAEKARREEQAASKGR
jgi:hypothetical protein